MIREVLTRVSMAEYGHDISEGVRRGAWGIHDDLTDVNKAFDGDILKQKRE